MPEPAWRAAAADAAAALHDLRVELSVARVELDAALAAPILTEEERRQLQDVARSGEMGRDMQQFAERVRSGEADWESFLRGRDENTGLLNGLLERAQREFGDEAAAAMAASEPPEDVEDPRPGRRPRP